jgi:hypothetical protein
MATELGITRQFGQRSANFFADRTEHDSVNALLVYWKDGDLDVDSELLALRELFGEHYRFHVATFPLPSDGTQQARLRTEIANFITDFVLDKRSLGIIYYTGHCRGINGKAQWTA